MKAYWTIYTTLAVLSILGIIGWFINIAKLMGSDMVITGEFILRIVGLFLPPIGAIMGYM